MSKILNENMGQSELELDTGDIKSPTELSPARAPKSDTFTHKLLPESTVSTHKPEPSTLNLLPKSLFGVQKTAGFGQQSSEFGGGNTSGGGAFSGGAGKVSDSGFGTTGEAVSTSVGGCGGTRTDSGFVETSGFGATSTTTSTSDQPINARGFGGAPVFCGPSMSQSSQSQVGIFGSGSQNSLTFDQLLGPSTSSAGLSALENGTPTSTTLSDGVMLNGLGLGGEPSAENANTNVFENSSFGATPVTLQQSQGKQNPSMSKILNENMGQSELELDTGDIDSPTELSPARAPKSDTFTHKLLPESAVSTHKPEPSTLNLLPKSLFGVQKTAGFGQQSSEFGGGNTSGGGAFSGGAGKVSDTGFGTTGEAVSTSAGGFRCTSTDLGFGQMSGVGATTTTTTTFGQPSSAGGFGGAPISGGISQCAQPQGFVSADAPSFRSLASNTGPGVGGGHSASSDGGGMFENPDFGGESAGGFGGGYRQLPQL